MEKLPSELTLVLDAFREHLRAHDTSQHTMTAYVSDVHQFVAWYTRTYQDFVLEDVTLTDIRRYREELQEQSPVVSAATINRRLAFFIAAFCRQRRCVFCSRSHQTHMCEVAPL